jgi:hypothetical protein
MSKFCPNINHPDFKKLEELAPLGAYSLFNKHQGDYDAIFKELNYNESLLENSFLATINDQLNTLPVEVFSNEDKQVILEFAKNNYENPVLIFKGLDGKKNLKGNKFSTHSIEGFSWGSYSYKDALTYARETGNMSITIVEGDNKVRVKAPKGTKLSQKIQVEEDLIKTSNSDLVELDTIDGSTKDVQVVFKTVPGNFLIKDNKLEKVSEENTVIKKDTLEKVLESSEDFQNYTNNSVSNLKQSLSIEEFENLTDNASIIGLEIKDDLSGFSVKNLSNKEKLSALTNRIIKLTNNEDKVFVISKQEFLNKFPKYKSVEGLRSVVTNDGKIFIFENASEEIQLEEVLHPVILNLAVNDKVKFNLFLKEVKELYPELVKEITENIVYKNQSQLQINNEIVTQGLVKILLEEQPIENKSFYNKILDFIEKMFKKLMGNFYYEYAGYYSKTPSILLFAETVKNKDSKIEILDGLELFSANANKDITEKAYKVLSDYLEKRKKPKGLIQELRISNPDSIVLKNLNRKIESKSTKNIGKASIDAYLTEIQKDFFAETVGIYNIMFDRNSKNLERSKLRENFKGSVPEIMFLEANLQNLILSFNNDLEASNELIEGYSFNLQTANALLESVIKARNEITSNIVASETLNAQELENLGEIVDESGNVVNNNTNSFFAKITSGFESNSVIVQAAQKIFWKLKDRILNRHQEYLEDDSSLISFIKRKGYSKQKSNELFDKIVDKEDKNSQGQVHRIISKTTKNYRDKIKELLEIKSKNFDLIDFLRKSLTPEIGNITGVAGLIDNNYFTNKSIEEVDNIDAAIVNITDDATKKKKIAEQLGIKEPKKKNSKSNSTYNTNLNLILNFYENVKANNGKYVINGETYQSYIHYILSLNETDFLAKRDEIELITGRFFKIKYNIRKGIDVYNIADNKHNSTNNYRDSKFKNIEQDAELLDFYNAYINSRKALREKIRFITYVDLYSIPNIPRQESRLEGESLASYIKRVPSKILNSIANPVKINKSDSPLGIGLKLREPSYTYYIENRSYDVEHLEEMDSYNHINYYESKKVEGKLVLLHKTLEAHNMSKRDPNDKSFANIINKNDVQLDQLKAIEYEFYGIKNLDEDPEKTFTLKTDEKAKNKAVENIKNLQKETVDSLLATIEPTSIAQGFSRNSTPVKRLIALPQDIKEKLLNGLFIMLYENPEMLGDANLFDSIYSDVQIRKMYFESNVGIEDTINEDTLKDFLYFIDKSKSTILKDKKTVKDILIDYTSSVDRFNNTNFDKNLSMNKFLDKAINLTRTVALGFHPLGGVYELLQGEHALFSEASGEKNFTAKDVKNAQARVMKSIKSSAERETLSKMLEFFRYEDNLVTETDKKEKSIIPSFVPKIFKNPFQSYEYASFIINSSFVLSILNSDKSKISYNGVEYTYSDIFKLTKDGVLIDKDELNPKLAPTEEERLKREDLIQNVKVKVYNIIKANRDRNKNLDPTYGSKSYLRALLTFKDAWFGEGLTARWSEKRYSIAKGEYVEGIYRSVPKVLYTKKVFIDPISGKEVSKDVKDWKRLGKAILAYSFMGSVLKEFSTNTKNELALDELTEYGLKKTLFEAQVAGFWTLLSVILVNALAVLDDDDEEESMTKTALYMALNLSNRSSRDLTTYFSPISITSFFKDTSPVMSFMTNVYKLGKAGVLSATGDAYIYDDTEREQLRVWSELKKVIPLLSKINSYSRFVVNEVTYE